MTTKFTTGPWEIVRGDFNDAFPTDLALGSIRAGDRGIYIAQLWSDYEAAPDEKPVNGIPPHGTAEANAHLISAAPDLYEALKEVTALLADQRDFVLNNGSPEEYAAVDAARAALAKAEGRS